MTTRDKLNLYLQEMEASEFLWGKNDCLIYTNNAYHAMYGEGWADDWLGRYMVDGKRLLRVRELQKEYGFESMEDGISSKLVRLNDISTYIPVGALVSSKGRKKHLSLGIYTGRHGAFLGNTGINYLPLDDIKDAWVRE